jgi:hypothetical protein
VFVNYATGGEFTVYLNSVVAATYSGDITTNSGGQVFNNHQFAGLASAGAPVAYISECIVATDDTRSRVLQLLNSTTAGATQTFTGTATNVNQTIINDANFVYSATAAQIEEYKPAAVSAGSWTVDAVVMSARALKGASGPSKMDFVTRIATTDYTSSDVTLNGSFSNYGYIEALNPATSAAFTLADLAPANFQYGIKSVT